VIKEAGFNSVRIPIRWSAHAITAAPYDIETDFFRRVDWAIGQALSRNLAAVINVHHYEEMNQDPVQSLPRLVGLWQQIALRYQNQPNSLMFELLNEPHDQLDDERWQEAFPPLLKAIRDSNPDRIILIGPAYMNAVDRLDKMKLPHRTGGSSARFTTTSRSSSRTRGPPGSTTVRPGGGLDGRVPSGSGKNCAMTSNARRHGPSKTSDRSILENSAPIGRRTWRIGRCGRGLWREKPKNGVSAGHIGNSAPNLARMIQQRKDGGGRS
jgi:Cellulase (glycosyl hydrolase family 5)